jgi:pimeloyl-ACP methyl ester carboxylesterase
MGQSAAARDGGNAGRVVPFTAGDGFACNLIQVRGEREPHKGPVILVHGAGVRANIFRAPVATTLVDALVADGYDVWLENWRASIDFPPNHWTLDQAALHDHPKAVEKVVAETGWDKVKAVIHCQGSTSFSMALAAGLLPQVSTVVTNAVSLFPVVPRFSFFKLDAFLPVLERMVEYLNPGWGLAAPTWQAKLILAMTLFTHHECRNSVCKLVSFTYGAGFPALWRHENLDEATHEWLKNEFRDVPLTFFAQMQRCTRAGHLVAVEGYPQLPASFAAREPETAARFAFFAGKLNRCFLPESQQRAFEFFDRFHRGYHSLHLLPTYGHLDVFMGARAARDVFPLILDELNRA